MIVDSPEGGVAAWLRAFVPAPIAMSRREWVLAGLGAWFGILVSCWLSHRLLGGFNPWFIAPMGASSVLLFAVPASPLAQPWSLVGGNLVAAAIGVTCARLVPELALAAALAASLSIVAMIGLRCLHPPSGAVALTAVFGGPAIAGLGYRFVLWPVATDSLVLLLTALVFNVAARRRYPHRATPHPAPHPHATRDEAPGARLGLTPADLAAALRAHGELVDIAPDDLAELFIEASHHAHRRRFGDIRCEDLMSRDIVSVQPSTPAEQAWHLMRRHAVKALPALDADGTLLGIVTLHDFFLGHADEGEPLRDLPGHAKVADIMTRDVLVARPQQLLVDLVTAFSDGGRHHLPVVDDERRLVGMVTQSDMVEALFRAGVERD
jgi:CBS domain-containing membrane protein